MKRYLKALFVQCRYGVDAASTSHEQHGWDIHAL